MSEDDFFSDNLDSDRTVIKPVPGRRGSSRSPVEQPAAPIPSKDVSFSIPGEGLNPLLSASATLLSLVGALRNTATYQNVDGLRSHVVDEMRMFEQRAKSLGVEPEAVHAARYALCVLLDETVLNTPWGSESQWSSKSLLSTFHNETWGGEKFFLILDRTSQNPSKNMDLLELLYICISLGFEGKYRVQERGHAGLDEVQSGLFRLIRAHRGEVERDLSQHWRGVGDTRNQLARYVPLWVVGALAGALLLATYLGFGYVIKGSSDPIYERLSVIGETAINSEE